MNIDLLILKVAVAHQRKKAIKIILKNRESSLHKAHKLQAKTGAVYTVVGQLYDQCENQEIFEFLEKQREEAEAVNNYEFHRISIFGEEVYKAEQELEIATRTLKKAKEKLKKAKKELK